MPGWGHLKWDEKPSKVGWGGGEGELYSQGKGLLEAGNETIQDEATLIHNEG